MKPGQKKTLANTGMINQGDSSSLRSSPPRILTRLIAAFFKRLPPIALLLLAPQISTATIMASAANVSFYNRSGVNIPGSSLVLTEGGWKKGRDYGFVVGLQKNTSYFYLWTHRSAGDQPGHNLLCDGNLLDPNNKPVAVDTLDDFTLGDLSGTGSTYLIVLSRHGQLLTTWNLDSCKDQNNLKANAQLYLSGDATIGTGLNHIVSGDFYGQGKDLIQLFSEASGSAYQWELAGDSLRLAHSVPLQMAPGSKDSIHGIEYAIATRLSHDQGNTAYESATIILHDKGYTLFQNGKALDFAPNCQTSPASCRGKTLLFNVDQGFAGGLQNLEHQNPMQAEKILERMISAIQPLQKNYAVWALLNPINGDRSATAKILDQLTKANIPFVLDYYSSDTTNLAYIKKKWLDYTPRAFSPLKGISLDLDGPASSPDSLNFYASRYGKNFAGVRIMERLAIDITTKVHGLKPMVDDANLAQNDLAFDWPLAAKLQTWAQNNDKIVIWSDPAMYIPYECYWTRDQAKEARNERDSFLQQETALAKKYSTLVPMYDNNEGIKNCGVASHGYLPTPRNFRLPYWQNIPQAIAAVKHGSGAFKGKNGFGLSVQSWTSDGDAILSSATLPPEEIGIWMLDAFHQGASIVELEPYYYFFFWPSGPGIQTVPIPSNKNIGDPRETLDLVSSLLEVK